MYYVLHSTTKTLYICVVKQFKTIKTYKNENNNVSSASRNY